MLAAPAQPLPHHLPVAPADSLRYNAPMPPSLTAPPVAALHPIPVIVNPGARSATAGRSMAQIRAFSPRIEFHETRHAGHARLLAMDLANAGAPLIVAAGGDGTVNEVVQGIAQAHATQHTAMGVLPTGTMNVFAAELGLPSRQLERCWHAIVAGHTRDIDLWELQGRCFVQLAGIGLDAAIISETTWASKKRLGPLSYLLAGLKVRRRPAPLLLVDAPGQPRHQGTVVLIGNGRRYGGPFHLFPQALPSDGLLDVVVMPQHRWRDFFALGCAMLTGHYPAHRPIHYFQTEHLRVLADHDVAYEVDGELVGTSRVLNVARRGSLRVVVPAP